MPETVVKFKDRRPIPAAVFVGNENDNLVERVIFELADWLTDATIYIYLTANGKSDVVNFGTERTFDVTRTHTHVAGRWDAYLEAYLNGDRVWHSDEFAMYVGRLPAIGKQIEQEYPSAIEEALRAAEMLTGMGARAETLAPGSEATVRIEEDENGERLLVFGIPAGTGEGGTGGYYTPYVDADGILSWTPSVEWMPALPSVNIKGEPGAQGPRGETGATLVPRLSTLVDMDTGVATGYEMNWQISNNPTPPARTLIYHGKDGTSPTVDVASIAGGHRVTITDKDGAESFDVMDGKDGDDVTANGIKAALGYTPADVKRVEDLEEDVSEIKKITDNFGLFVPKFANTAEGEELVLTDSAEGALHGLRVFGRTTQDGTTGKNLLPVTLTDGSQNGLTWAVDSNGRITVNGTATAQTDVKIYTGAGDFAGKILSGMTVAGSQGTFFLRISNVTIGSLTLSSVSDMSITLEDTGRWDVYFRVAAGVTMNNIVFEPMIRAAGTNATYEPYTGGAPSPSPDYPQPLVSVGDDGAVEVTVEGDGSTQTLSLSTPNGLPSVGDVCDEIDLERGVYVQRVGVITMDGTVNGATSVLAPEGRTPYCFINTKRPLANKSPVQSTHFVYALTTKHGTTYGNSGETTIRLFADGLDTKEKWNAWLAAEYANGTPVVVCFVLATPIETPLSDEEIAAYKALKTHYPTTTIYNDESARMTIKYAADTKNYIDQHLAALAAAMVNNL